MRMINDLEFVGESSDIGDLMCRIDARPDDRWCRNREAEQRLKRMFSAPLAAYCLSVKEEEERPAASLWLEQWGPDRLVISDIVSAGPRSLTDEEHNAVLAEFESSYFRPLAAGLKVEPRTISAINKLEKALSSGAIAALRAFSETANRTDLHPLDWRRWQQFLVQSHLNGADIDGSNLDWWLARQGWPEGPRCQLVESFESSRSLLNEYDEERVPS